MFDAASFGDPILMDGYATANVSPPRREMHDGSGADASSRATIPRRTMSPTERPKVAFTALNRRRLTMRTSQPSSEMIAPRPWMNPDRFSAPVNAS